MVDGGDNTTPDRRGVERAVLGSRSPLYRDLTMESRDLKELPDIVTTGTRAAIHG
jgi:hypothetical protein